MKYIAQIKKLAFAVFLLFFIPFCLKSQKNQRPNIVWIVTEDNSKHFLKLYEKGGVSMPNIESLAKKGVVFNHAFSNAPVCSVARSTIISGCYAPRIGAQYHRRTKKVPMPDGLKMFPAYLKDAGYYTTNNSKEDYNMLTSAGTWDESSRQATYKNRKAGQPFFHVQNFGITHEGQLHFSKEKMEATQTKDNPEKIEVFPYHPDNEVNRYTYAWHRDLHRKADQAIGDFLEQLEADGLMENTFIFYYGDHGGVLARSKGYIYESGVHVPLVVYIPEQYRSLVSLDPGSRSDAFVSFIDLGPTVLNLAGVSVPTGMDGKAFLGPGISKSIMDQKKQTYSYADRFDEKYDLVRAIRKGKYKYIRNYQPFNIDALFNFYRYKMLAFRDWAIQYEEGKLNAAQSQFFEARTAEALYDIENDPHEVDNLAKDPQHQKVLLEMRAQLQAQVRNMPDLSFYPEPYFLEKALANPVAFGQANKEHIAELVQIADLSLIEFKLAKKEIKKALKSKDPWKRYWGLIVCSSFGADASSFYKKAKKMAMNDAEALVQIRAIEFLALNDQGFYEDLILDLLKNAPSETEANLLLNSVALIKSQKKNFKIQIPTQYFKPEWIDKPGDLVNRRLEFINKGWTF